MFSNSSHNYNKNKNNHRHHHKKDPHTVKECSSQNTPISSSAAVLKSCN